MDNLREPFPVASADPGGVAFPDAVEAGLVAVHHVDPSADGDPEDALAYAAALDQVALLDPRGDLAYGVAEGVVHPALAVLEVHSCAEGRAVADVVHGDWAAEGHVVVGDLASAYGHPALPVGVPEASIPADRVDEMDLVPVPYGADPGEVPAAVDRDYVATGKGRGFAKEAPLDSAPGAEA